MRLCGGHGAPHAARRKTHGMVDSAQPDDGLPDLMRRIIDRDRQALSDLYDGLSRPLFSLAYRMLGDMHDAEDTIQDVFVQIWNKASQYNPAAGTPAQWAVRMTRNRCIDRLRARQREGRVIAQPESDQPVEIAEPSAPAEAGISSEEAARIRAAVNALPQEQRQALELVFFSGLSHSDVASALKQPLGTVKARIRRGMLKLRDSLGDFL
jgi:RNA polymerase sigma-70 factor (ECF subfamily)